MPPAPSEYLEQLQQEAYARLGYDPIRAFENFDRSETEARLVETYAQVMSLAKAKRMARDYARQLQRTLEHLPTRFESPDAYLLIDMYAKAIQVAAGELGHELATRPLVGTLPLGQVNAITFRVPDSGEYLVVFEPQLFTFCNLFAMAILQALPLRLDAAGRISLTYSLQESGTETPGARFALQRFDEAITAYLLRGETRLAPAYLPDGAVQVAGDILVRSMELFVLGHEIAHVLNDDLSKPNTMVRGLLGKSTEEVVFNWDEEFLADSLGLKLMLHSMGRDGYDFRLCYWGAEFFLCCIEVVMKGLSLIRDGQEAIPPSASHPPPNRRRAELRATVRAWIEGEEDPDLVRAIDGGIEVAKVLEQAVERLWSVVKFGFLDHHNAKGEVAQRWRLEQIS